MGPHPSETDGSAPASGVESSTAAERAESAKILAAETPRDHGDEGEDAEDAAQASTGEAAADADGDDAEAEDAGETDSGMDEEHAATVLQAVFRGHQARATKKADGALRRMHCARVLPGHPSP